MKQLNLQIDAAPMQRGPVTIPEPARTRVLRQMAKLLLSQTSIPNTEEATESPQGPD